MKYTDAALVIAGHGSTLNADSSAPTYQHADEIRRRRIFAEVHECFWKEEPNFHQGLRAVESERIYIVPNFISSGYFTEEVIPREFGLTGPVTQRDGKEFYYCEPVGLHPTMEEALRQRAQEVVAGSSQTIAQPEKNACLMICGHGTSLNDNSTKIIYQQVEKFRRHGGYAEVQAVFMEQEPFIQNWRALTSCPDVVVVPFFISDGLHSFEDIPQLIGMPTPNKQTGVQNPFVEANRRLWYASAIGTEPYMADVILAQVKKFDETYLLPTTLL